MNEQKAPYVPRIHNMALAAIQKDSFQVDSALEPSGRRVKGLKFAKTWATKKETTVTPLPDDPFQKDVFGVSHFLDEI